MDNPERLVRAADNQLVAVIFSNGCSLLSNLHFTPFVCEGAYFRNIEQFIYTKRAIVSHDYFAADAIKTEKDTRKYRNYTLSMYNHAEWVRQLPAVLEQGLVAKFSQHENAKQKLLSTANALIVYANPNDHIFGTGLTMDNESNLDASKWEGMNVLGYVLAAVRDRISK